MPWPVHPNGLLGAQGDSDSYRIERSLRFNSADSAYLNRTLASATNRRVFTFSAWVKLTKFGDTYGPQFITNQNGGVNFSDTISIYSDSFNVWFAGGTYIIRSTQVLRDSGSWYHLVAAIDTTQATAANRVKLYINGVEVTSLSSSGYPPQNYDTGFNTASVHYIGQLISTYYSNMYLTEFYWIDGQALTPSSFGETDAITGRWKAKAYSGTYGTNGFYLKFADNSGTTSTTLGKDSSGNGNNWTPNNFSVTAGAGNDSLVDSPTNYGADSYNITVDNSRGNYNTFNPLSKVTTATLTNGNLDAGASGIAIGSIGITSGKWYWEVTSTGGATAVGLYSASATSTRSVAIGVTEGFRFDASAGTLDYTTNGSTFTSIATGLTSTPYFIYVSTAAATTASLNCGQRLFAYSMPSGYKTLCTTNLPTPTIKKPSTSMDVVAYTGTGASNSISSLGFSPDLVWIKNRGTTTDHAIYDIVRGTQAQLSSNLTDAEITSSTGLTTFGSNGFTIGTSTLVNTSGTQYVSWAWDAGSSSVSNTSGSITSTVRANPQAGFSIVGYTGNGTAGATVGHGLGTSPSMIITKKRSTATSSQWTVGFSALGWNKYILLNTTGAAATDSNVWNSAPTSSVFYLGNDIWNNHSGQTTIAYCFSEVAGFSRFGSYIGNGSADGVFVWCGFRPRYVLFKNSTSVFHWQIYDAARNTVNVANTNLYTSSPAGDQADGSVDFVSNGFKLRSASFINDSGSTIIFAAFAESPFKYARAR